MQPPARPTGTSNLMEAARSSVAKVNVQLPATVVDYDDTTQTATIKIVPCFRRRAAKNAEEQGQNGVITYCAPAIPNVPVAFLSAGGYSITFPLEAGDTGILMVCDRSIDEWKAQGGTSSEPQDMRRHDLSDGIFLPATESPAVPLESEAYATDAMVVHVPAGKQLRLGSASATDPVALSSLVDARLSALATAFSSWTPVPMDGGLALKSLLTVLIGGGWPASVAASKARAE